MLKNSFYESIWGQKRKMEKKNATKFQIFQDKLKEDNKFKEVDIRFFFFDPLLLALANWARIPIQ